MKFSDRFEQTYLERKILTYSQFFEILQELKVFYDNSKDSPDFTQKCILAGIDSKMKDIDSLFFLGVYIPDEAVGFWINGSVHFWYTSLRSQMDLSNWIDTKAFYDFVFFDSRRVFLSLSDLLETKEDPEALKKKYPKLTYSYNDVVNARVGALASGSMLQSDINFTNVINYISQIFSFKLLQGRFKSLGLEAPEFFQKDVDREFTFDDFACLEFQSIEFDFQDASLSSSLISNETIKLIKFQRIFDFFKVKAREFEFRKLQLLDEFKSNRVHVVELNKFRTQFLEFFDFYESVLNKLIKQFEEKLNNHFLLFFRYFKVEGRNFDLFSFCEFVVEVENADWSILSNSFTKTIKNLLTRLSFKEDEFYLFEPFFLLQTGQLWLSSLISFSEHLFFFKLLLNGLITHRESFLKENIIQITNPYTGRYGILTLDKEPSLEFFEKFLAHVVDFQKKEFFWKGYKNETGDFRNIQIHWRKPFDESFSSEKTFVDSNSGLKEAKEIQGLGFEVAQIFSSFHSKFFVNPLSTATNQLNWRASEPIVIDDLVEEDENEKSED